jgi:hypothetical protein
MRQRVKVAIVAVVRVVMALVPAGWLLAGHVAAAQSVLPRDRPDPPARAAAGTAAIQGRVVDGQTGLPLPRVRIRLNGMSRMSPTGQPRGVTTDESGSFAFTGLPSGLFMISAEKSTYLPARFPAGETLRSLVGTLALSDGQRLEGVVVPMYHGGAIAGHVIDSLGDPVEFAQVQALRLPPSGRAKPQSRGGTMSNDLGEYRIARLEPGQYLLYVTPQHRPAVSNGGRNDVPEPAEPEPVPTFYPGVPGIGGAQPIAVGRGTTASDVDIPIVDGFTALVSGTLLDASGRPASAGASISARPIMTELGPISLGMSNAQVQPDGGFQIKLPPGEYELQGTVFHPGTSPRAGLQEYGLVRVNVSGDTSGVTIQAGTGARVSGRIVFDGASAVPPGPTLPNRPGSVVLAPKDDALCRMGTAEVQPDWSFTVEGVIGTCVVRVTGGLGPWTLKSVMHEERDLTDRPILLANGQEIRGVEVVLTDKRSEVAFHVTDEHGAQTRDYVGIIFPTDDGSWADMANGRIRTLILAPDPPAGSRAQALPGAALRGREVVGGLPAGDYYAIAVDDLETDGTRDPGRLAQLSRAANRVTLTEGAHIDLNLRRISLASLSSR